MPCNCRFRKTIRDANVDFNPERTIYLDNNATTPVDPRVIGAFDAVCRREWANPSSLSSCGIRVFDIIEQYRVSIAEYFGCHSDGIHFCSSGSEAIHAGLFGIHLRNPERVIISTQVEHSSITHPLRHLRAAGSSVIMLPVDQDGRIDIDALKQQIKNHPRTLLIYSPVNHETGAIQPVENIYNIVKQYDCVVLLDGVQAAARLDPAGWVPFCDMFAASGHKIYAPKGSAFLWNKKSIKLRPFRFGGYQEDGLFPGTENTPGIAAMAAAFNLMQKEFTSEQQQLRVLIDEGLRSFETLGVPFIVESPTNRVAGVVCISLPWIVDMERFMFSLNKARICISRFSACTSRVTGPSKILASMGRPHSRKTTSLRIACGRFTKREDFQHLAKTISNIYKLTQ